MSTNPSGFVGVLGANVTPPVELQLATGTSPVFGAGTTGDAFDRIQMRANGNLGLGPGTIAPDVFWSRPSAGIMQTSATLKVNANNLDIGTAGNGLQVAEGANAKQGTAVLVAGTVTVANTSVTANSRIFLTAQALGGTQGILAVTARVAGTSFTITSSNAADTSTVAYEIFEPG